MKIKRIESGIELVELVAGRDDWARQPQEKLLWIYQQMVLIRTFEEQLLSLKDDGLINGPVHTSVGQEAVAVGAAMAVNRIDKFTGTHRAHHQYLAKALGASVPDAYDVLRDGITDEMRRHVATLLREVMGLADGCSGGRGGSMHLFNPEIGIAGTNAIVAGGVPPATGVAWADAMRGRDAITICFFGDGAVYQGTVHESCNLASLWNIPIIYAIENNHYAVGTSRDQGCSAGQLCQLAVAYGMPGFKVDGMDPVAVMLAVEHIRSDAGRLPCVLEIDTYRHYHHAGRVPGSAFGYRQKDEEEGWRERDPLTRIESRLRADLGLDAELEQLQQRADEVVAAAVAEVLESDGSGGVQIRPELWPAHENAAHGLRDGRVDMLGPFTESEYCQCDTEIKYSDAIAQATGRWLAQDDGVVVMGEEVCNMGGGAYGATKDLYKEFPERVRNTPITEAGFCGLACGAAMNGMHPVVELMFSSFCLVAADQLFNQIGQLAHIYGGNVSIPLVCRTRIAAGLGYGAQHSMDPVGIFSLFPGWRIVVPTTPFDYIGLFNSAMRLQSPTLIVEHHMFYGDKGMIPGSDADYLVEIGKAKVLKSGSDVTALTYGWGVSLAMRAAAALDEEGLSIEVIDLRTLDDAGLDRATIGESIRKTGALVVVEEAQSCNGMASKLIRLCERHWFDQLDGPAAIVNAADIPLPVSRPIEEYCLPNVEQAIDVLRKAARREF